MSSLCVALDSADRERITRLAAATRSHADVYKIGLTAFTALGPSIVHELIPHHPVFLDLKLHDIPVQVEGATAAARATGASYVTVHATGGSDMIKAAVAAADRMTVLAVTVLTSLDDCDLEKIGSRDSATDAVARLAGLALDAGAPGLVCSPHEVAALRERFGARSQGGPLLVVPGVRPPGSEPGDQRRVLGPREAVASGADVVVVGRPITAAADPGAAARAIREELD